MGKAWALLLLAVVSAFADGIDGTPVDGYLTGTPAIEQALGKLNMLGSVLMIGAHPDDENNAVLTYVSRGMKARTGYLSLNRGEGGQNLLGNEQGALLGVIRTQELLAARRDDGGRQFFTRAIDFGFTTSLKETIDDWGHDKILSDIVWVIRQQQPDVIVLVFSGTAADGHGNHQASAVLGKEAFEAAGDPSKFPEQLKWVKPWKAKRLMRSRFSIPPGMVLPAGFNRQDAMPNQPTFSIDTGTFDPVIGRSYREISVISRSEHRSQGQGGILGYGTAPALLALVEGDLPVHSIFDGVDTSWNRVPGGARVGTILAKVYKEFDDMHPEKSVAGLLEARALVAPMASSGVQWGKWKLDELDSAIALCAGIHVEAEADRASYVPGSTAKVKLTAVSRSGLPVVLSSAELTGWGTVKASVSNKKLANNELEEVSVNVPVPVNQAYSQPFWLKEPRDGFTYTISDQQLIGRADVVPEVLAHFEFTINGAPFEFVTPMHYRFADPAIGQIIRPVVVQPPVAIDVEADNFVFPTSAAREVSVQVRGLVSQQSGEVRFETPAGWKVEPAAAPFSLKDAGEAQEIRFRVTPPGSETKGQFKVTAKAGGVDVATGVDVIGYPHIPTQTVLLPSAGKLDAAVLQSLAKRVGYVMGSADKEPEALRQMGVTVDLLTEKDLSSADLSVYDAIVTGIRAYALRPDLRASQPKLLEYVQRGGTLVVQYNNNADARGNASIKEAFGHLGPYPFALADNDARVTQEDAPVKVLQPNSPLLNVPNKISPEDWDGWVQERGLYFAIKADSRYQTPVETHDKGEKDLTGALLYTPYGKGAYVFTAFSWFRELPAGVPGAYRIFANLISAGKAAAK